ncbi:Uncharacterised protein [Klebsiella pneumoniae]|uniref:Uncharacterized protein n=1 Tax=Klebsiella pneumoniae TaxID=573 RepID=A0A486LLT0_KLEPN|nr:Uncharacterised protein [Enterobacter hormaechei]SAD42527.1 Uncharacterised protein [Enterobacter cloacae]SLR83181.1 Uncharacterised protein [Klebsiella pneumoniae]SQC35884.1 Uncharacterised protein [Kluyvera cryocrescens]GCB40553.1 hypothetical protein CITFRE_26880 [Citrobacter freundii]
MPGLPQCADDLPPVEERQHHVQYYQIILSLRRGPETIAAIIKEIGLIAFLNQSLLQVTTCFLFVFND